MELSVKIGTFEQTYVVVETTAPAPYDSGQAFTIHTYDGWRLVAVPTRDIEWQTGRNHSGLHPTVVFDPEKSEHFWGLHVGPIAERLMTRLMTPAPGEA